MSQPLVGSLLCDQQLIWRIPFDVEFVCFSVDDLQLRLHTKRLYSILIHHEVFCFVCLVDVYDFDLMMMSLCCTS